MPVSFQANKNLALSLEEPAIISFGGRENMKTQPEPSLWHLLMIALFFSPFIYSLVRDPVKFFIFMGKYVLIILSSTLILLAIMFSKFRQDEKRRREAESQKGTAPPSDDL